MHHLICRVSSVEHLRDYILRVGFDDGTEQTIDFAPVLLGEIYGPLRDPRLFEQVRIDSETHTLVWPNGADFDPETLHDWLQIEGAFRQMAEGWVQIPSP